MDRKYTTIENMSAVLMMIWGAFIFNPYVCSFQKYPQLYAPMSEITSYETVWGGVYILSGAVGLYLSLTGRQKAAALLISAVFTLLGTLFFLGDFESQGWGVYGFIGISNGIVYFDYKWKAQRL